MENLTTISFTREQLLTMMRALGDARDYMDLMISETSDKGECESHQMHQEDILTLESIIANGLAKEGRSEVKQPPEVVVCVEMGMIDEVYVTSPVDITIIDMDSGDEDKIEEALKELHKVKNDPRFKKGGIPIVLP